MNKKSRHKWGPQEQVEGQTIQSCVKGCGWKRIQSQPRMFGATLHEMQEYARGKNIHRLSPPCVEFEKQPV